MINNLKGGGLKFKRQSNEENKLLAESKTPKKKGILFNREESSLNYRINGVLDKNQDVFEERKETIESIFEKNK